MFTYSRIGKLSSCSYLFLFIYLFLLIIINLIIPIPINNYYFIYSQYFYEIFLTQISGMYSIYLLAFCVNHCLISHDPTYNFLMIPRKLIPL